MTVVAFTAYNRVGYMREVLESWSHVRGIGDAELIFRVEPNQPEMANLCRSVSFAKSARAIDNPERYGALGNPWYAMDTGFDTGAEFVVLAEDDSIVSTDVLEYFDWAAREYQHDKSILAVCAFWWPESGGDLRHVNRQHRFAPTIWGTWADRWHEVLGPTWDFDYSYRGWDWNIIQRIMGDRKCLFPAQSRSQHIGRDGGTHMTVSLFQEYQSKSFVPDVPRIGQYEEIQCASW